MARCKILFDSWLQLTRLGFEIGGFTLIRQPLELFLYALNFFEAFCR